MVQASGGTPTLMQLLNGIQFPASRDDLVACVRQNSSDGVAANLMEMLPKRSYESMGEVMQALVTSDEAGFADDDEDDEDYGDDEEEEEEEYDDDDEDEDEDEDEEDEDEEEDDEDNEDEDEDEEDEDEEQ